MSIFSILYSTHLQASFTVNIDVRIAEAQAIGVVNEISTLFVALTVLLILFYKENN